MADVMDGARKVIIGVMRVVSATLLALPLLIVFSVGVVLAALTDRED